MAKKYLKNRRALVSHTGREEDLLNQQILKRKGNIQSQVVTMENLIEADRKARKGKAYQYGIKQFDKNSYENFIILLDSLLNKTYRTSPYTTFTIEEPKVREVYRLPYIDRVAQHAYMNVLEKDFVANFTADTYSCIKGRGIGGAFKGVKKALKDIPGTTYCLKMDIRKFYPSVDHDILKSLFRRKIKDRDCLYIIDGIIDSAAGVPIGNYLSQYLANFYMSGFDHWLKEKKKVKYYFRYADDMVIIAPTKAELHQLRHDIQEYLRVNLKLELKPNYQVFPVSARGIDFVGYVFFHTHILLRKSIKKNFARKVAKNCPPGVLAGYKGWTKPCNSKHLLKKLLYEKVQRPGDSSTITRIHRRQNKNRKAIRKADSST